MIFFYNMFIIIEMEMALSELFLRDLRGWMYGVGCMGLDVWGWMYGVGCMKLDVWGWMYGVRCMGLDVWG